jgi:hypothetical protein
MLCGMGGAVPDGARESNGSRYRRSDPFLKQLQDIRSAESAVFATVKKCILRLLCGLEQAQVLPVIKVHKGKIGTKSHRILNIVTVIRSHRHRNIDEEAVILAV